MSSQLKVTATEENKASVKNGVKRLVFVLIALVLEVALNVVLIFMLNQYSEWITVILHIIAALLVLVIYNQNKTSAMKIPWIMLIMALPLLGMTLYLLIGLNPGMHSMKERYKEIDSRILPLLTDTAVDGAEAAVDAVDKLEDSTEDREAQTIPESIVADIAEVDDEEPEGSEVSPAAETFEKTLEEIPEPDEIAETIENMVFPEPDERVLNVREHTDLAEKHLRETDPGAANIARYLEDRAGFPAYENVLIEYYDDASKGIEAQKEELRKAQKFIFMEYHAIENAESWQAIQEILEDRVKAGVEVRVFYDDMGSIGFIDTDFVKLMESKGIRCRVFNPFKIGLNLFLNNRDHRKITVVDGVVGFTGGYNIANEYFNITHPFGHWKDTGVKIYGPAVRSLTVMFLEMWNAINGDDENDSDFAQYINCPEYLEQNQYDMSADASASDASTADSGASTEESEALSERGFVIPYGDMPLDDEHVGEDVYISVAEYAKEYAWYITPYLILTDEMIHALGLAAKRGVDVRVITPGIPDKPTVYSITRSYYQSLVRNGVRIFEYTPGFCHCKMSIADDAIATCGTINLDYRSLYHHFENGCLYAHCKAVMDTKKDFEATMAECREVTDQYRAPTAGKAFGQMILRLVAPLL